MIQTEDIGQDVSIDEFVVIRPEVKIGNGVIIHPHVVIESRVIIEDDVEIFPMSPITHYKVAKGVD